VQQVDLAGLTPGTEYHFAMLVQDEAGNVSYLSNVARVLMPPGPDTTPPGVAGDLAVRLPEPSGTPLPLTFSKASSEQAPSFAASNLVDGSTDSMWVSQPSTQSQVEWVQVDLGEVRDAGEISLWPAAAYAELFPRAFELRVSPDGLAWTTVLAQSNYSATPNVAISASFTSQPTRFVELRAPELASSSNGYYYAAASELEVQSASEPAGTAVVSWTAPGDDGFIGDASQYDLRISSCPFNAATSTAITTWAPLPVGTPERYTLHGLSSGQYCTSLKTLDEVGNVSAASGSVAFQIP
jgi:hypothetical protein